MEDRRSSQLYLELGDSLPQACDARMLELAELSGVDRVTWWENGNFQRSDLPMRIRDGRTLVLVEADDSFVAPPLGPRVAEAHCFRLGRRPSQGILTGRPTIGLLVVWISPKSPELARTLRDWGDFVHIRHIAAAGIPGFTQISVYENVQQSDPRFMHLYEFDSPGAEATFSTMVDHVAPRLGGVEASDFAEWAEWRTPGGRLFYCNTFDLRGEKKVAV